MNVVQKDVIKKWVEALRSGKYKQARGKLRNHEGYCCLGVLCELAAEAKIIAPANYSNFTGNYYYEDNALSLPYFVKKWAGINQATIKNSDSYDDRLALTYLNDTAQKSFTEIADIIEKAAEEGRLQ